MWILELEGLIKTEKMAVRMHLDAFLSLYAQHSFTSLLACGFYERALAKVRAQMNKSRL